MCLLSDCKWPELGGYIFKVGQLSKYARMNVFFLAVKKNRERERERERCAQVFEVFSDLFFSSGVMSIWFLECQFLRQFILETGFKVGLWRQTYQDYGVHRKIFEAEIMTLFVSVQ